jgi:DNA-binding beta-propeller fold protein YncE
MGILLAAGIASTIAADAYTLQSTIPVPGGGSWDYLIVDEAGRRLYVSHGTQVEVVDVETGKIAGVIPDTNGVHGIAIAAELNRGFTSNGKAANVTVFDLKTLKKIDEVKTGRNPDCIIFDPATKRVFAFNGAGNSATAIEAADSKVAGTVELGGRPEYAAVDGAGNVFVNIEDKNTIAKIDAKTLKVVSTWPLAPGEQPASLAIDAKNHRLFAGCRNKLLVVVDSESGKVVAKVPIGTGADATAFDPKTSLIFTSCGDGTVSVVHADGDDKYSVVETIKTKARAKTMALDSKTGKIYLPAVDYAKDGKGGKGARGAMVPNSFAILVYGK